MGDEQQEVMQILAEAKVLARRYYKLTNKPLGVTGELAEFEVASNRPPNPSPRFFQIAAWCPPILI